MTRLEEQYKSAGWSEHLLLEVYTRLLNCSGAMETLQLSTDLYAFVAVFLELQNAAELRQALVHAAVQPQDEVGDAARARVDFAFVDASMITSRLHLLTAVLQAVLAEADGLLRTKTLASEVLWYLEPGNNIQDSLRHFGMSASTTSLALIGFAKAPPDLKKAEEECEARMRTLVNAKGGKISDLGTPLVGTNWKSLRKLYKLNGDAALSGIQPGSAEEIRIVDRLCISSVPLKAAP